MEGGGGGYNGTVTEVENSDWTEQGKQSLKRSKKLRDN